MNTKKLTGPGLGLLALLSIAACGGGSSGNNGTDGGPTGAAPRAITTIGSITGFGSVFVNGTRYEVAADTRISIEDEMETMGDDSVLRLGMKVRVTGTDDNGRRTATSIEFDEDLKGPIESITPDALEPTTGTISVMSQIVTIDGNTVFDDDVGNNDGIAGIDIRDLQVGMVVEVSGFPTDNGFLGTRIDREVDAAGNDVSLGDPNVSDDELEIKGFVDAVADNLSSITVGGVVFVVDSSTMLDDGLVLGTDLVGAFVEVEADIAGGNYVAVKIEREDIFDIDDRNGGFEIEGVLQAVDTDATPNTFTINGITVPVTDASPLTGLVGMRVEIEGSFNADGVLVVREAEQDVEDNVRTEDLVATIQSGASFTTRLGIVVTPTGNSRVQDDAVDNGDHLTAAEFLSRLQRGDRIEARGLDGGSGSVAWTRVERDDLAANVDDFECELRGPVESISGDANAFSFDIQGVTVMTGRVAENNFEDANDMPIGRAEFFSRLQAGTIVEAESFEGDEFCMMGMLDAREVSLEPLDD